LQTHLITNCNNSFQHTQKKFSLKMVQYAFKHVEENVIIIIHVFYWICAFCLCIKDITQGWFLYLWPCTTGEWCLYNPEKDEHAFSSRRIKSWMFFKWGDDIQMTCFSFLGCSDAAKSCCLLQCCRENHYPSFRSKQLLTCFQSFSLHLRCKMMWYPSSAPCL